MAPPNPTDIGRYKVLRTLGEGGMGKVFLAEDPAIDRLLAIKLMRKGFDDGQMRERFTREARAIGRLRHPNIVMVFDVGEHDGDPFIAMEYVEGEPLSGVIRNNPDMPVGRKLEIMDALCSGLYYAHRNGVIHRDIKPPNIMVDTEGGVKILDFGIARGPASGMTQAGTVIGTLNYMAPEQLAGKRVDLRADIWAVGAVFYELLTGEQAFPGDIQSGVLHQILMGQPTPLAQAVPGLHPEIIAAVEQCLHKNPDDRFSDLDVMRRTLAGLKGQAWAAEAVESTIRMPSMRSDPGPTPRGSRTPGPETRAQLLKLREDRIAQQLSDAREALESRDYARAMEACQQALIIDPENAAAQELQDQVRAERQAHGLVIDAKAELDRGALTQANALIEQALTLAPALADAKMLRDDVADARRRQEAQAARARAVTDAIARARQQIAAGSFEQAMAAIAEVHRLDPGNADAARLSREVEAGRAAKARADEDARATRAASEARQQFAAGRRDRALAQLRDYRPAHPVVIETLQALERERVEVEQREADQRRQQEEARRKADEAARNAAEVAARRRAEDEKRAEERRQAEARQAREQADAEKRAEDERRRLDAKRRSEEEAKRRSEEDARRKAEEVAKRKADDEAKRRRRGEPRTTQDDEEAPRRTGHPQARRRRRPRREDRTHHPRRQDRRHRRREDDADARGPGRTGGPRQREDCRHAGRADRPDAGGRDRGHERPGHAARASRAAALAASGDAPGRAAGGPDATRAAQTAGAAAGAHRRRRACPGPRRLAALQRRWRGRPAGSAAAAAAAGAGRDPPDSALGQHRLDYQQSQRAARGRRVHHLAVCSVAAAG